LLGKAAHRIDASGSAASDLYAVTCRRCVTADDTPNRFDGLQ